MLLTSNSASLNHRLLRTLRRTFVSVWVVLTAIGLRYWPLQDLGFHIPYLTFFPAVTIAALYGGLYGGLVSTLLATAVIVYWLSTGDPQFISHQLGWESLAVFLTNSLVVSAISEAMIRARRREARAVEASEQERQRTEEAQLAQQRLSASEYRFRQLFEHSPTGVLNIDPSSKLIVRANTRAQQMFGYSAEELPGRSIVDLTHPDDRENTARATKILKQGATDCISLEKRMLRKDGSAFWVEANISGLKGMDGKLELIISSFTDITERKQAELKLQEQDELFREMSELAHVGGWSYDRNSGEGTWTSEVARILDTEPTQSEVNTPYSLSFFQGDYRNTLEAALREASRSGKPYDLELELTSAAGKNKWVRIICHPIIQDKKVIRIRGAIQDITDCKLSKAELLKREIQYHTLFENSMDGVLLTRPDGKILTANPVAQKILGYTEEELRDIGRQHVVDSSDPRLQTGLLERKKTGHFRGELTLIRKGGEHFPAEVSSLVFNDELGQPMSSMVIRDITELKRAQEKITAYIRQLEGTMEGTLQAVAKMVDLRDPYTAGHERRVGLIAADIAREMGWPEEKCQNLKLIGLVHDIGKIAIPAEILAKPDRLTDLEYEMIKAHAEKGYEILKDVDFPLPIAEIIRQHHERLDGSGYPRKLKGDAILAEARVLSVADVVESMASHRPYRPSLGIESALKELSDFRGIRYDPAAVDALLNMIHFKGYVLPA
ncbi:MAG: PAS domain S-box protein [Pseudomonadota bacterium]